jgi:hypothetical protein
MRQPAYRDQSIMNRYSDVRLRLGRRAAAAVFVLPALGLTGCDFDVSNPGPIQDRFLDDPAAHGAMVNGAGRALAEAINWTSYTGAAITRELHPAGSTASFGISPKQQVGILAPDETSTWWNLASRARWTAERAAERISAALGADFATSERGAQVLVWAGYANRHLGENWCEAVIDAGPLQPRAVFFERAEDHFTQAMQVATAAARPALATAAQAGRAAARVHLGDWAGAVADAAAVPTGFVHVMPYYATELDLYNRVHYASANSPYRAHTVWNTVYQQYYQETGDPRVAWKTDPSQPVGDGAVGELGRVPWYIQLKHPLRASPIRLSTGREMRLIEAEASLRSGNWTAAMLTINDLRTAVGAPTVTATSAEEAWTHLKRERGVELWLESRRLGDRYRWDAANTPGALHPLEIVSDASRLTQQDLCFPIPDSERQTNPNL